ncbi:flavodoxin family protein [Ornithinimicrobium avium]|uniref:Flavodoxin family protein n=1 Tax=Ornithinimicrobium avium TaxID=2283195 RepID=A0A345NPE0_9MICO|nr:NAD(P)H-dependent oxidoreductase [Ornithinimicrobium avium]AXH96898.1 flavodoxin family protein [Ornithinimicrobium avium]
MTRLLVVHHTPSPGMQAMLEAALSGARDDEIEGVEVVLRPALVAGPVDVLEADAYLLGTPANIGYLSGAMKHFFDQVYYPCLDATRGRPYAAYVHGNEGLEGAVRAMRSITSALGWEPVAPVLEVLGTPDKEALAGCTELGGVLAATVMPEGDVSEAQPRS